MKGKIIFDEQGRSTWGFFLLPKSKLFSGKSKFQEIEVFEHDFFGRVLRLDGYFQTSELDEFLYHEPLVQYPLFAHNHPKKVLIIGGGDGGSLEEVAKHKDVERIVMVELDKNVVEVSKRFLEKIHKNAFDDRRAELLYMDGIDYVNQTDETFDVVIMDLTGLTGEALKLHTMEFYDKIKNILNKNGVVSLHTGLYLSYSDFYPKVFGSVINTLKSVFKHVSIHENEIPLYGGIVYFALCSENIDFERLSTTELQKRLDKKMIPDLRYYTPSLFVSSFELPKYVEDTLSKKYEIITLKNQISDD